MTRTEPIRVRAGVAAALRELTQGDETRISDFASTLIILSIFDQTKPHYQKLSPETQAAVSAEVMDLLGVIFQKVATGMTEEGLNFEEYMEKKLGKKATK